MKFVFKGKLFLKVFFFFFLNVERFYECKMMILVLWIENVFNHGSGVCHIVYGVWGG